MGLRVLAYHLDRTEAVIVQSVLLDAGVLAIIGNEDMLRMQPYYELAFGGYRVLVSDLDLEAAISVIQEARANPVRDGETLVVRGNFADRLASLAWGWLAGGAAIPVREWTWSD